MKLNEKQLKETVERVKKSLLKQKEILSNNGVDLSKQWAEMQKSLKK